MIKAQEKELKIGNKVYVKSLGAYAKLISVKREKKEAEVLIGDIKTKIKFNDIFNSEQEKNQPKKIQITKSVYANLPKTELNVLGKTSLEAITEVQNFIDQAIINSLEEIKIIHGVGEGILLKEIRNYLKTDKNVAEFRRGKYGEGENGVTIIKLK
jgi:DNA mismatch repair protein MutS2